MPYLQTASFANNRIMDTEGLNHPLLESLNLKSKYQMRVTLKGLYNESNEILSFVFISIQKRVLF